MKKYIFICIGTNKMPSDSFGPRVGEKLKESFKRNPHIQVFGTMKKPIHFQNAKTFLKQLEKKKTKKTILIDSAFGNKEQIGSTYISSGGIELGKAYGKSFYFPAFLSIKTVIGNQQDLPNWTSRQIDFLAKKVANQIIEVVEEL